MTAKKETFMFFQFWKEPICIVQAPPDTPLDDLLVMAREWSLGQRLDYYQRKSDAERYGAFLEKCREACGGDPMWALALPRSREANTLSLAYLSEMLEKITHRIPNNKRHYPYL